MMNTCQCGCGLPIGQGRKYLSDAHKQKAYRQRKRSSYRALSRYVGEQMVMMMGEEKANEAFAYLDQIPTDKYNRVLSKALAVVMTAWMQERTKVK
jgi:hypothetical protein